MGEGLNYPQDYVILGRMEVGFVDIKIAVATTKKYRMPEDDIYLPLQVGAAGRAGLGYARDDTGVNISKQNSSYSELTGLYWLWKNTSSEYCGLVHYRRLFANPKAHFLRIHPYRKILDRAHLQQLLQETDLILPAKRRYVIESMYSHYSHSHYDEHINAAKKAIADLCPEYLDVFRAVLKRTNGHMFNMFIMKREMMNAYCTWLFPILEAVVRTVDTTGYDAYQMRFPGRVSELLLDVWMEHNGYTYQELPVAMLGRVHWVRKGWSFLAAKLFKKRYSKSF